MIRSPRRIGVLLVPLVALAASSCLAPGAAPTFGAPVRLTNPQNARTVTDSTAIGDVTGDGRPDLVVSVSPLDRGAGALLVYPQTASGQLGSPRQIATSALYNSGDKVTLADLNGDGHLDAVLAAGDVEIFRQAVGTLVRTTTYPWMAQDVQVADINRDGRPDLVTVESAIVHVHLQRADGSFAAGTVAGAPVNPANPGPRVEVADVNGDSRPDLVGVERYGFWVASQTAAGSYGPARHYTIPGATPGDIGPLDMAVGDLTGDGRPDVVLAKAENEPNSAVEIFVDQPGGTFDTVRQLPSADSPGALTVADVTGDGRKDLLVSHFGWNELGVYAQRSDGTLSPESLSSISYGPYCSRCVAVGDLDSDRLADVAIVQGAWSDVPIQVLHQRS